MGVYGLLFLLLLLVIVGLVFWIVKITNGNWSDRRQKKMVSRYKIVRQIAESKGSYYALRGKSGNDLYLLSPEMRLIIWINYNY